MAFNGFKLGGGLGTGIALGIGAALLLPAVVPIVTGIVKPLAKAVIKGGIVMYEKGKVITAEATEAIEDLTAEAKAEIAKEKEIEAS